MHCSGQQIHWRIRLTRPHVDPQKNNIERHEHERTQLLVRSCSKVGGCAFLGVLLGCVVGGYVVGGYVIGGCVVWSMLLLMCCWGVFLGCVLLVVRFKVLIGSEGNHSLPRFWLTLHWQTDDVSTSSLAYVISSPLQLPVRWRRVRVVILWKRSSGVFVAGLSQVLSLFWSPFRRSVVRSWPRLSLPPFSLSWGSALVDTRTWGEKVGVLKGRTLGMLQPRKPGNCSVGNLPKVTT